MPVHGGCKIRKRGGSSSSPSTASVLQRYRLKRPILVRKRGGSTTPVPVWMMNDESPLSSLSQSLHNGGSGSQPPVSARKLATALWEVMNKIPPPSEEKRDRRLKQELMGRNWTISASHSPDSERMRVMPVGRQKGLHLEHNHGAMDRRSSAGLMEIDARSSATTLTSSVVGMRSCLKDLSNGLMTSKELLKLLSRIWGLKETHAPAIPLVSALRVEMDRACVQVDQLIQEQKSDRVAINCLKKQFTEELSVWKSKEEQRIRSALHSLMDELESEKRLRRRAERLNKKLGTELGRMKVSFVKAVKEVEEERRSRERLEQVCSELVRGIGEDKAKVEELKRESTMFQEELEKEREMLQVADAWREERIQMKLSEAKFQFEEKNADVDRLKNELEAYLTAKSRQDQGNSYGDFALELENHRQLVRPCLNEKKEAGEVVGMDEEDDELGSEDSGLNEETEMLHIADEQHEERVVVNISKVKSKYEERNAAVDQLKYELEAYMSRKRTQDHLFKQEDATEVLEAENNSQVISTTNNVIVREEGEVGEFEGKDEVDDGVNSVDSDLHSIELNVDSSSKSYSWSYAAAATKDETKLDSLAEEKTERITKYDHTPRSNFSLHRGMGLSKHFHNVLDEPDQGILSESSNLSESQARIMDQERYRSVKALRDQILAASSSSLPRGLTSPTRQRGKSKDSKDMINYVSEGLNITEIVKAARENSLSARLVRNSTHSQLEIDPIQ